MKMTSHILILSLLGLLMAHVLVDVSADFIGQGELAVRKRAGAGPAVHNAAGVAVNALAEFSGGTGAAGDGSAGIDNQDRAFRTNRGQLHGGEDAGRTGTDDDGIKTCLHSGSPLCYKSETRVS